ncbi:hypothetical protein HPP92_011604 [Vanilla planifolia]|uniref:Uncharacterized protein n=1 Tax=Vanilla planifolia TaxID=51239 RepID=A0A835V2I7_VANPL|nr:hypothetical protein HPP92_011604 [Vanilla planifolia]
MDDLVEEHLMEPYNGPSYANRSLNGKSLNLMSQRLGGAACPHFSFTLMFRADGPVFLDAAAEEEGASGSTGIGSQDVFRHGWTDHADYYFLPLLRRRWSLLGLGLESLESLFL